MSHLRYEGQEKTLHSYLAALKEITEICPDLDRYGSGFSLAIEDDYEPAWGRRVEIRHADAVRVEVGDLFDYGRPAQITEQHWVWRGQFFVPSFSLSRPYTAHGWEIAHARTEEDGRVTETKPAHWHREPRQITLHFRGPRFGLKDWRIKAKEIRELCAGCSEPVREAYADRYGYADEQVAAWEKAIKRVATLELPT